MLSLTIETCTDLLAALLPLELSFEPFSFGDLRLPELFQLLDLLLLQGQLVVFLEELRLHGLQLCRQLAKLNLMLVSQLLEGLRKLLFFLSFKVVDLSVEVFP